MANKNKQTETDFLNQSKVLIDKSIDTLDSDIEDKLARARRKILAQHYNKQVNNPEQRRWGKLMPAIGVALAASVILGIFIQSGMWQSNSSMISDNLELIATLDNIELYDDLDFYQWLAEDEPQAG